MDTKGLNEQQVLRKYANLQYIRQKESKRR